MSDFGTMKTRIGSDLERTLADASYSSRTWEDEIEAAIQDAIKLYKSKRWWFVAQPTAAALTSTTTADNSYIAEYTGLVKLESLRITIDGQKEPLEEVTFEEMERFHDGSTSSGQPYKYNRHAKRVRLYPTPSQVYTITWSGTFEEATLTLDADTNDWMTDGELVIRSMAKLILLRDYIKSYDDVPGAIQAIQQAEKSLNREHGARVGTRRIRARC